MAVGTGLARRTSALADRRNAVTHGVGNSDLSSLNELLRKRSRKLMTLLPQVITGEDRDAVHDLRVWSRRLQQVLAALFHKPYPRRIQACYQAVRNARRALGGWRNCDVVMERIAGKEKQSRSPLKRRAWRLVGEFVEKTRAREMRRARKKLLKLKLLRLASLKTPIAKPDPSFAPVADSLPTALSNAYNEWQGAVAQARETPEVENVHAFRIATKRLRYRIELARDLSAPDASTPLAWLKSVQDRLGRWHDRSVLIEMIAQAVAQPELLTREPQTAIALLQEIKRERNEAAIELQKLLAIAGEGTQGAQLQAWVKSYCSDRHKTQPQPEGNADRQVA